MTREGEFFRCGRSNFLLQNAEDFLKVMVCPQEQGQRVAIILRFCADVFMDGLLIDFVLLFG